MKQLLHLKTMLVTLLTMLVAMNASAQQTYYSEGFEWASQETAENHGWTIEKGSYVRIGNGQVHDGKYSLQVGSSNSKVSRIVSPVLSLNEAISSNVTVTLWFYLNDTEGTIVISPVGDAVISSISTNNTTQVTCNLNAEGTATVTAKQKKFFSLSINLSNCDVSTKLRFATTKVTYIEDITVTGEASSDWKYNPESVNVTYGDNFTAPVLNTNGYNGTITYTSSNPSVATVDASSGEVTILAVGVTKITASGTATSNHKAGVASYTLIVKDIQGSATGGSGASVFKEAFSKTDGTGGGGEGNENSWKGDVARSTVVPDEKDWTFSSSKGGGEHCVKLGKSGGKGYAMTRYIDVEIGKTYTLTFRAAPWDKESANMVVTVTDGCDFSGIINKENMTPNYWNYYTATITPNTVNRIRIKFEASKDRFFLDEINVAAPSTSETVNVTIPSSGWGTFCYKYPLDFTAASSPEGLKAYAVSATTTSKATLTQITEKIIGGTGIIINGEPGTTYTINVADKGTAYSGINLLTGTLAPTYVEEGQYFLKSGQFVYSSAGILPKNKSYLKKENAPEAAANFGFVTEDATGISEVRNNITLDDDKWYDLSGRAVSPTSKGIYIHNGKKYVIK